MVTLEMQLQLTQVLFHEKMSQRILCIDLLLLLIVLVKKYG